MSLHECPPPDCHSVDDSLVDKVIRPHEKDLGGMYVRRVLPALTHRRVGPFIFFDHMGPSTFAPGTGMDVRPHPHIGLSTLTYLFEGQIMHRDSLGYVQPIEPRAVNWMTAGRGIVHSERTPDALRATGSRLHGIQSWIALPDGQEEVAPSFTHHPTTTLPVIEQDGASITLIAGEAFGERSPVHTYSPLFYLHMEAPPGTVFRLPGDYPERAFYVVHGEVEVSGQAYGEYQMIVLAPGREVVMKTSAQSCVMILGGTPLSSDRTVWWNFSSSSPARLDQAKQDWREGRFEKIPGETEFIPLPE